MGGAGMVFGVAVMILIVVALVLGVVWLVRSTRL